jgi:uncharacterized protein YerC
MEKKRKGAPVGNSNAYKGDNISFDINLIRELRSSHSWNYISKELGIPRTTLMREVKRCLEYGKSLGYEMEL